MFIKQTIRLIIISALLFFPGISQAQGAGTMMLQPDSIGVQVGDQFPVMIMLDATGLGLESGTAVLSYDSAVLKVLTIDDACVQTFDIKSTATWNSSTITIECVNAAPHSSDGPLATIIFEGKAAGVSPVVFTGSSSIIDSDSDEILVGPTGGTYAIDDPPENPGEESGDGGSNDTETGDQSDNGSNLQNSQTAEGSNAGGIPANGNQESNGESGQNGDADFGEGNGGENSDNQDEQDFNYIPFIVGGGGIGLGILATLAFNKSRLIKGAKRGSPQTETPVGEGLKPKPAAGEITGASSPGRTADFPLSRQSGQLSSPLIEEPKTAKTPDSKEPNKKVEVIDGQPKKLPEMPDEPISESIPDTNEGMNPKSVDYPLNNQKP